MSRKLEMNRTHVKHLCEISQEFSLTMAKCAVVRQNGTMNTKSATIEPPRLTGPTWGEAMRNKREWEQLAELLRHQRVVVLGHRSRAAFARSIGISDRVLHDLENGHRDNYEAATLLSLEAWYGLSAGQLRTVLGNLYPMHELAAEARGASVKSARSKNEQTIEELQHSVDSIAQVLEAMRQEINDLRS